MCPVQSSDHLVFLYRTHTMCVRVLLNACMGEKENKNVLCQLNFIGAVWAVRNTYSISH